MVTQVRVCAGQARPLTETAASKTLARSDGEIGGSKMGPLKKSGNLFSRSDPPVCQRQNAKKAAACVIGGKYYGMKILRRVQRQNQAHYPARYVGDLC